MSSSKKSWSAATQAWYDEVKDWRYGVGSVNGGVVGHFTQVRRGHLTGCLKRAALKRKNLQNSKARSSQRFVSFLLVFLSGCVVQVQPAGLRYGLLSLLHLQVLLRLPLLPSVSEILLHAHAFTFLANF